MAKKYELVLIIDPQIGDTQLEAAVEKYKTQLESIGAEVVNVDPWGLRKLAYTSMALRQRQQAFYVLYQFEGSSDLLGPLDAALRLDEAVLRHLLIAIDGEFLRVPQLAPENVYIYNPPERPRDRRGPRRDRDSRRDDGPPGAGRADRPSSASRPEEPASPAERPASGSSPAGDGVAVAAPSPAKAGSSDGGDAHE